MKRPHHLLQLVPNTVAAAVARLGESIWTRRFPVALDATEPSPRHRALSTARGLPRSPVSSGDTWGRLYDQRWCRLDLPEAPGSPAYLEWRDQGEATLYLDNSPYYGFDPAHRYCALPPDARDIWVESICVQTGTWHADETGLSADGSRFEGAWIVSRDDGAWHAYHDLGCLFDLMLADRPNGPALAPFGWQPSVDRAPPEYRRLLRILDEAVAALHGSGVAALRARLAAGYRELHDANPVVRAVITGHAHLDLVWLWPEHIGEVKAVHTFATADRLMELYPEFRFNHSQPATYEAIGRRAPELLERVRRRIALGQWQATGALQVESDTLLPCGEALARSFIVGQRSFAALRGEPSRLLWLPDVFGYSACLPQLMKLCGIDYFFTNKLSWSAVNRFPLSSFVWRGSDGSEVLAHVLHDVGYSGSVKPSELRRGAAAHVQSDVHPEFLYPTGYGDGGGGATEEMCERARRLSAVRGLPAVSWDLPEAFFDRLAERRASLPVYAGELYLEYHRGTYTTRGLVKAAFRKLERALQAREAVAVATRTAPDLEAAWKRMIFTQFHDYVPGTSVAEVYAEGLPELGRIAGALDEEACAALGGDGAAECLFNPLPIRRQVVVGDHIVELPPLGGVSLSGAKRVTALLVKADATGLDNGHVALRIDGDGGIASMAIDGEPLALLPGSGRLMLYPDRAASFECWDIDRQALTMGTLVDTPITVSVDRRADGSCAAVAITRRMGAQSVATIRYVLERGARELLVKVDLDWREPEMLLKYRLVTAYRGSQVRCGAPFGSILRPQQPGPLASEAMWEIPFSRWIAGTDDGGRRGMFIATEAKYGISCDNGDWGLSLVRSPRDIGFEGHLAAYPVGLSRLESREEHTDIGRHSIKFALGRYDAAAPRERHPAAVAETCFSPPLAYVGAPLTSGFLGLEGGETLMPCWAKPIGSADWVLRLHEVGGERGRVSVLLEDGWRARRVDLHDRPIEPWAVTALEFGPYEIVSLRICRAEAKPPGVLH